MCSEIIGENFLASDARKQVITVIRSVVGIIGSVLRKNATVASDPDSWEGDQRAEAEGPPNPPSGTAAS
jgi:hypothetical protein